VPFAFCISRGKNQSEQTIVEAITNIANPEKEKTDL